MRKFYLLLRDELIVFLKSLDKAGRETDRGFFLESWTGKGGVVVDRIGRGTQFIEHVCLSLIGTIQPGVLKDYIQDSLEDGRGADGLVQRFQLLVCPKVGRYIHRDEQPNSTLSD